MFCWWFFAIGKTISQANWGIAGNYLADWVSYEIRPEFDIDRDGAITVTYPRFDPIGPNPNPDWIETTRESITRTEQAPSAAAAPAPSVAKPSSTFSFMTSPTPQAQSGTAPTENAITAPTVATEEVITEARIALSGSARIDLAGERVMLVRGDETVTLLLDQQRHHGDGLFGQGAQLLDPVQQHGGQALALPFAGGHQGGQGFFGQSRNGIAPVLRARWGVGAQAQGVGYREGRRRRQPCLDGILQRIEPLQQPRGRVLQGVAVLVLQGGADFNLAALEAGGQQAAQRGLHGTQFIGEAERKVQEAAVDRADFQPQSA